MIVTFQSLINYILYFNLVRCSSEQITTQENQNESTDLLSFSFDKKSFQDFQCNFNNRILSHSKLKKKPFYYSVPVKNLLSTFCLFFQFSQINNNEDFRCLVENLFNINQGHIKMLFDDPNEYNYSSKTFTNQIKKFQEEIDKMLAENGKGIVTIKEKDGRIYIIQDNNSSAVFSPNFLNNFLDLKFDTSGNEEVKNAMVEFYTKYNEMNLLESLSSVSYESLKCIFKRERKKTRNKTAVEFLKTDSELEILFKKFCHLININVKKENETEKDFNANYDKYYDLIIKMQLCGELSVYCNDLFSKRSVKYHFEYYQNKIDYNTLDCIIPEDRDIVIAFREILKKVLSDPAKINYGSSILSDESFDNLVKNCLELVL